MLEMNRDEFTKAMDDLKATHATASNESEARLAALEEQLKAERADKTASALHHVSMLPEAGGAVASLNESDFARARAHECAAVMAD